MLVSAALSACEHPTSAPTAPTAPVGSTWTATAPVPPAPEWRPTGSLGPDPVVGTSPRLRTEGAITHWGLGGASDRAPSLAAHPDGAFVVAFEHDDTPCTSYAQRVDRSGVVVLGSVFLIAGEPACSPSLGVDGLGRFVAASDPETRDAVALHRLDDGLGIHRVFDVVTGDRGLGANRPALAVSAAGDVVTTWLTPLGGGQALFTARAYDPLLVPVTEALDVDDVAAAGSRPAVAFGPRDVVVAWSTVRTLAVARWSPPVFALTARTVVAAPVAAMPGWPALAVNGRGDVVVAWHEVLRGAPLRVAVAVLDAADTIVTEAFVPTEEPGQAPALALLTDDAVALAWSVGQGVDHEVWLTVLAVPSGDSLLAPVAVSVPGVDAGSPTLAVSPAQEGEVALAVAWEERPEEGPSVVSGRVYTFGIPSPPFRAE
jgi:hypothetical protein